MTGPTPPPPPPPSPGLLEPNSRHSSAAALSSGKSSRRITPRQRNCVISHFRAFQPITRARLPARLVCLCVTVRGRESHASHPCEGGSETLTCAVTKTLPGFPLPHSAGVGERRRAFPSSVIRTGEKTSSNPSSLHELI